MKRIICQVNNNLPAQCCGEPADQIYRCEQIQPPGHRHQVGEHTILHERMGNGYSCQYVEKQVECGGLTDWLLSAGTKSAGTKYTVL